MGSTQLTPVQLEAIRSKIAPLQQYLRRLRQRMIHQAFPAEDAMLKLVSEANELLPMLKQFPTDEMQAWPVGKAVGNVRNHGPELVERV